MSRETNGLTRRELVKRGAVLVGGTAIAPAYAGSAWARRLGANANTIKIGFVSPITGATAPYTFHTDTRFMKGTFIASDERRHHGAFAFI